MGTLSSFSISKPPPIKPPMPSLRPLLFLGLSALLSSTMAQMGLDDDETGGWEWRRGLDDDETGGWDGTMGQDDPNNTNTMASGLNTNHHLLAKRATTKCSSKCCYPCTAGKQKLCEHLKKLEKSMGKPPACTEGKYCNKRCILAFMKKHTGK